MRKLSRYLVLLALAVGLFGCSSKEPLDYLPAGTGYIGINVQKFYSQQGCKRLAEVLKKIDPENTPPEKSDIAYVVLRDPSEGGGVYVALIGKPGSADEIFASLQKNSKVTPVTVAGMKGYRVAPPTPDPSNRNQMILVKLSDSAILASNTEAGIEEMKKASRKKVPGAAQSAEFMKCQTLSQENPFAFVANVSRYAGALATSLGPLAKANPKAAEALSKIQVSSLTAGWDNEPKINVVAYTSDEAAARDIATLANFMLGVQRNSLPPLLRSLVAVPSKDGISLELTIPKESADQWLDKLEQIVTSLPQDQQKRMQVLTQRLPELFR